MPEKRTRARAAQRKSGMVQMPKRESPEIEKDPRKTREQPEVTPPRRKQPEIDQTKHPREVPEIPDPRGPREQPEVDESGRARRRPSIDVGGPRGIERGRGIANDRS